MNILELPEAVETMFFTSEYFSPEGKKSAISSLKSSFNVKKTENIIKADITAKSNALRLEKKTYILTNQEANIVF
jgi:hypothetical protein